MAPPLSSQQFPAGTNALQNLMTMAGKGRQCHLVPTKKRGGSVVKPKAKTGGVGFVDCPAGCGCHIVNLGHKINQHLDRDCPVIWGRPQRQQPVTPKLESIGESTHGPVRPVATIRGQDTAMDCSTEVFCTAPEEVYNEGTINEEDDSPKATQVQQTDFSFFSPKPPPQSYIAQPTPTPDIPANKTYHNPYPGTKSMRNRDDTPQSTPTQNVFAHMMQQSSKVFASKKLSSDIPQYFTLDYDAANESFTWNLSLDPLYFLNMAATLWKCTVPLKDKARQSIISLTLSVTCSNCTATTTAPPSNAAWVQRHSRLSVPVLKSILQKSVRRRRPLPSVRVAMELQDKALGDMLRRLPIIILEDSTLHPDFALIVWAMVAHSKGFFFVEEDASPQHWAVVRALKLRLLRIVYQVASCPVQDHWNFETEEATGTPKDDDDSVPCMSQPFGDQTKSSKDAAAKDDPQQAMSKQQLQVAIWAMLVRATYGGMACDVNMLHGFARLWHDRLLETTTTLPTELKAQVWSEVPAVLHGPGMAQSQARIPSTATLPSLVVTDLCKEGVDFHCSNIVPSLLEDGEIRGGSGLLVKELNLSSSELLLKRCIWKFSAGINLRRPLLSEAGASQASVVEEEPLKAFWTNFLSPSVTVYQTRYLGKRIWQ